MPAVQFGAGSTLDKSGIPTAGRPRSQPQSTRSPQLVDAGKHTSIWAAVVGLAPGAPGFQLDTSENYKDIPMLIMVGEKDNFIASMRRLDEQLKSLKIAHDYKEMPGKDHGTIIMGGMPDVFSFFSQHTKPETAAPGTR